MTALPAASDFTGAAVTEGQFKSAITDLRGFLAALLGTSGTAADARAALGVLGGAALSKASNYTVTTADIGRVIDCSATLTLSLPAAASAGAGFTLGVYNSGAGTVTVDGNLAETIDDASTISVDPGKLKVLYCNGTEWASVGGSAAPVLTTFTANGTWSKAATTQIVIGVLQGGGGGSGGGDTSGISGGAGQSGSTVFFIKAASAFSTSETVTIGTAGAAGAGSYPNGNIGTGGGQTSLGSIVKAKGGGGGTSAAGAAGGAGGGTDSGYLLIGRAPDPTANTAGAANTGIGGGVGAGFSTGKSGGTGKATILEIS